MTYTSPRLQRRLDTVFPPIPPDFNLAAFLEGRRGKALWWSDAEWRQPPELLPVDDRLARTAGTFEVLGGMQGAELAEFLPDIPAAITLGSALARLGLWVHDDLLGATTPLEKNGQWNIVPSKACSAMALWHYPGKQWSFRVVSRRSSVPSGSVVFAPQ